MVDVLIIGAGAVGTACAAESALRGYSTVVVERHSSFGQDTSSRNSEVIHSGIYYPPGSLKAALCVRANETLKADCESLGVWSRRCGKLIVAVDPAELPGLEELYRRGAGNGVPGLEIVDGPAARRLEPAISCVGAIVVPSTGIIDSHALMKSTLHLAVSKGASVAYGVRVEGADRKQDAYLVSCREHDGAVSKLEARYVINSAGLHSDAVAAMFGIDVEAAGYALQRNKGQYYMVSGAKSPLISRLIYPMPHPHLVSVGIHVTIDRNGQCRLGPDMGYLDPSETEESWYRFDDTRRERFYSAVSRYFPALEPGDLSPGLVGVRPKRQGSEKGVMDFVIAEESGRGLPGLVNLVGIESPGLTCSREIGRYVFERLIHN